MSKAGDNAEAKAEAKAQAQADAQAKANEKALAKEHAAEEKERLAAEKRAAVPRVGVLRPDGTPITKNDGSPMTFNTKKAAQAEADRIGGTIQE